MNTFSILRTNVGLTSNVKIIVSKSGETYLESIDSNDTLSDNRFKKYKFNKENYWDQILSDFFKGVSSDISFNVKYDNDVDIMFDSFENQFDDLYFTGCQNISNNKDYSEDFEAFSPIYIESGEIPKGFIIFRVDGPGNITLDKNNFRQEILEKFKVVEFFDLSDKSNIGYWLDKNINKNKYFPLSPLYIDFRNIEFSYWNGVDLSNSGYISSPIFMENILETEMPYFDFHKFIYDGYKENNIVFPNIFNLSFLFDDTPATKNSLKKWSLNRYYGFYLEDLVESDSISFYKPLELQPDVSIDENNFLISSGNTPFIESWRFKENEPIQVLGNFYPIVKLQINGETKWKIISDISLNGLTASSINNKIFTIDQTNKLKNNSNYQISGFSEADVLILEIDNQYFRLIQKNGEISILCDGGFRFYTDRFEYFINDPDPSFITKFKYLSIDTGLPKNFKIYKLKFLDVKDFDTQIIDTQYSRYEYEYNKKLHLTDETKLYVTNLLDDSDPKNLDQFNLSGEIFNIPVSSEFTANNEISKIDRGELSEIWRKNPKFVKWGFNRSISSNDYPYLLNNCFLSEDFNKTANPFNSIPNREDRNLDYFYSIMTGTNSYSFHSLHIQDEDINFGFDLDQYLNSDSDYFTSFFGKTSSFSDGELIVKNRKWSKFNKGDFTLPNETVFRGIKFTISDVDNLEISENSINTLNLNNSNEYDGWKFSILLDSEFVTTTTTTSTTTESQVECKEHTITNNSELSITYSYLDCSGELIDNQPLEGGGETTGPICMQVDSIILSDETDIEITVGTECS